MVSTPFSTLVGQTQAVMLLTQAIQQDRIAPAYLFVGPPGVGRRLAAREFLALLIAHTGSPGRHLDNHPDLLWVEPTYRHQGKLITVSALAAQGETPPRARPQVRLAQIRQMTRFLSQTPLEASRLLAVIDQAETMAEAAANGLLKTLEEPGNATLVLLAPTTEALLPTLVSRCQRIPFYRLSHTHMAQVLTQADQAHLLQEPQILAMAQGSPGAAIAHWEQQQAMPTDLLQACCQLPQSPRACLALARQIEQALDLEAQLWLIDYLQQDYWQRYQRSHLLQTLEQAKQALGHYAQPRLVWEVTLLSLYEQDIAKTL